MHLMAQTNRQTEPQADGHRDSMTESAPLNLNTLIWHLINQMKCLDALNTMQNLPFFVCLQHWNKSQETTQKGPFSWTPEGSFIPPPNKKTKKLWPKTFVFAICSTYLWQKWFLEYKKPWPQFPYREKKTSLDSIFRRKLSLKA